MSPAPVDQLDHLDRLEQAHHAGQHAEHAGGAARRRQLGRRRSRVEAAVARALVGVEDRQLALEAEDRRRDDRGLEPHARVVQQVARREVVEAVDDHVVPLDDLHDVVGAEPDGVLLDLHVRVDLVDRDLGGVDLRHADAVVRVRDLALQVREVDHVVVDDPERADARGGEVERRRRAEPARAEQEHLGVEQLHLPLEPDLGDQQVARVALALLGGERARNVDVVAAVLPERDAAAHRRDVLVAEQLLKRVGGERRAAARGAVEDHALRAVVADGALDARLQMAARHVDGARQMRLLELVLLAHVDDHRAVSACRSGEARGPRAGPPPRSAP